MITTLTGDNDVLRQSVLHEMITSFITEHTDMAVERLDGEEVEYSRMHEATQGLPFLVARKLVVLRKPSGNKDFIEYFEQFVADTADTNDIIIVEPKLDKRLAYFKQLKKLTEFREFKVLDGSDLERYLIRYTKERGGSISVSDTHFLIDRVGSNQLILQHELDKLIAQNPSVTRATIEMLTDQTPQSSIFELLDAAFSGDTHRTMKLYDEQRDMRVEPQQIIAMLVWQLHILAIAKAAATRSADLIAKDAKISPFTVRKSLMLTKRISTPRLKSLISALSTFDVRLKNEGISADETIRYFLVRIAQGTM